MSIQEDISSILETNFSPQQLEVVNESRFHAGHAGDDGSGESHFKIIIVSEKFHNLNRVACHRMVYQALESSLDKLPHALSVKASAPDAD